MLIDMEALDLTIAYFEVIKHYRWLKNMTILDIIDRCNLKCVYCCRGAQVVKGTELSNQDIIAIAQQIIQIRGTFLVLQGGEPTLKKDLISLLKALTLLKSSKPGFFLELMTALIKEKKTDKKLKIDYLKALVRNTIPLYCITTNGMVYTEGLEKALYQSGSYLEISLDAPNESINKQVRIGLSFNHVIQNIKKFTRRLPVEISCTVAEHNIKTLPEMIPFARDLGCICLKLSPVIMIGSRNKPDELWIEQYIDSVTHAITQYQNILEHILLKVKIYPDYLKLNKGKKLYELLLKTPNVLVELHQCTAGCKVKDIYIDTNMDVYPCASMKNEKAFILGNLKKMTLKEIWNSTLKLDIDNKIKKYNKLRLEHHFYCTASAYSQLKNKEKL